MSSEFIGIIGLCIMLVLMFSGVPVYASLIFVGISGLTYVIGAKPALFQAATLSFDVACNYDLLILPFFIFMASVFVSAGLGSRLYKLAYTWVGSLPGGLAVATVITCALFGAVCASETATTVTLGVIAIKEMRRYNYNPGLACGSVASADTLATLIPPSSILVIYGVLTEQSIAELFVAGIVPGVVLMVLMAGMVVARCVVNPDFGPRGAKTSLKEKLLALCENSGTVVLALLVFFGILFGWVTPTEAGAYGAIGACIIGLASGRVHWSAFQTAAGETVKLVGMLYAIIVGAFIFVNFIILTKIPFALGKFVVSLDFSPVAVMAIVMALFIVLGCFIEVVAMIVILVPIFYPIVIQLGFDPLWFGVIMVVMGGVASITPPVGMSAYVIKGIVPDIPLSVIFEGAFPFFLIFIVFLCLLLFFPQIVTFLPSIVFR